MFAANIDAAPSSKADINALSSSVVSATHSSASFLTSPSSHASGSTATHSPSSFLTSPSFSHASGSIAASCASTAASCAAFAVK